MLARVDNLTDELKAPPGLIVVAGSGGVADETDVRLPARGGLPPRAFRRVREYVVAHLAEDVSNFVLAELVGLSPSHFSRAFKQSAGVSPHRFVLQSRIERVKHLLAATELPLAQIAVTAGFGDQSHCSRWFHALVGITPSRFRWLSR
jgi:transcriptional regulator GlxA family with amidase domain